MAITVYKKTLLTGGTSVALDSIDGALLLDGDYAIVTVSNIDYGYILDDDLGGAENSPLIIAPDVNPGNKRWVLQTPAFATLPTKNPPIDADLSIYRDSTAGNALVTSTFTQKKAFLKTYFDTIYQAIPVVSDWTPSLGGNTTYTVQSGKYIKIGRSVVLWGQLTVNVLGTGSTNIISGAPFSCSGANAGGVVEYFDGLAINVYSIVMDMDVNGTALWCNTQGALDGSIDVQSAIFGNGAAIRFSISYLTAT